MIRPLTGICVALAVVTVLYTYRSKHEVQLLDKQIEKTLHDTETLHEQSRALQAEWTLRENPERLRRFADQYLSLKPLAPGQFTSLADLDSKLPSPRPVEQASGTTDTTEDADTPAGQVSAGQVPAGLPLIPELPDNNAIAAEELPIPPLPVPPPPVTVAAILAVPAERKTAAPKPAPAAETINTAPVSRAVIATPDPRPPVRTGEARVAAARPPVVQIAAPLQAPTLQAAPAPVPRAQAQAPAPAPSKPPVQAQAQPNQLYAPAPQPANNGSLLGMAHGGLAAPMPLPRPMPINATQWTNGN
jgi:hypothetical protein